MLFGLLPTMMLWGGGEKPATWVIALSPFFISGFIAILLGAVGLFIYAVEDWERT